MRKQKNEQQSKMRGYMMPDVAYPFVMDRIDGMNRAIAEPTFGHLVSTTDDAREERRAVAGTSKVRIKITGNTQPNVLQADLYRKTALPIFGNVTGGETGRLYLFQSHV